MREKFNFIFFIIIFLFSKENNFAQIQKPFPNDFFKGKVKKVTINSYNIVNDSSKLYTIKEYVFLNNKPKYITEKVYQNGKDLLFTTKDIYNEHGYKIKLYTFYEKDKKVDSTVVSRSKDNSVIKVETYDGIYNVHFVKEYRYEFNKKLNERKVTEYIGNKITSKNLKKYDKKGRVIKEFENNNGSSSETNYFYNSIGKIEKKIFKSSYHNYTSEDILKYDKNRLISEESNSIELGAKFSTKKEYFYDNDNLSKIVDSGNGVTLFHDYDLQGNWTLQETFFDSKIKNRTIRKFEY